MKSVYELINEIRDLQRQVEGLKGLRDLSIGAIPSFVDLYFEGVPWGSELIDQHIAMYYLDLYEEDQPRGLVGGCSKVVQVRLKHKGARR